MRLTATRPALLEELAIGPAEALRSSLSGLGFEDAVAFGRARGGTSTCYFLRAAGPAGEAEFVCKCPLPGESIETEWQVLNDAAKADGLSMRLPRPVALLGGGAGFLMERLRGEPLPRWPGLAHATERAELAARVIADLRSFHAELQHGFGDFHARNVLVEPGGTVVFLDAGESADLAAGIAAWPAAAPLVADLALWTYNTALDAPGALHEPWRQLHAFRFAVALVGAAAEGELDPGAFTRAVFAYADRHANRLRESPWRTRRASAPAVVFGLSLLRRASLRAVSRRAGRGGGPQAAAPGP